MALSLASNVREKPIVRGFNSSESVDGYGMINWDFWNRRGIFSNQSTALTLDGPGFYKSLNLKFAVRLPNDRWLVAMLINSI